MRPAVKILALCEYSMLVLRPFTFYLLIPHADCGACRDAWQEYDDQRFKSNDSEPKKDA